MASLYIDEDIADDTVDFLQMLGHDVLTATEANQAAKRIPDDQQLAFACELGYVVVTHNRWDFIRLHQRGNHEHFGIVVCTRDNDYRALAQRIHDAIVANEPLQGKLIRVNRPA